MKKIGVLLLLIALVPSAFAEISLQTDQHIYNLGKRIHLSASLTHDTFEGLFRIEIECSEYKLMYFTTPVSLESGFATAIDVPDLTVTPSMLGPCRLNTALLNNDGTIEEEKPSSSVFITNELTILPVQKEISALPSESIRLSGVVNDAFGNGIISADFEIKIDDSSEESVVNNGIFETGILLPSNIKSGSHDIIMNVNDKKTNTGTTKIPLNIIPVPSYIKNDVSEVSVLPGSKINLSSILYDQADDPIDETLELNMMSPSGANVFFKTAKSSESLEYEFGQFSEPGEYSLKSSFKEISTDTKILVSTIREVKVSYENQTVFIQNVGNLLFNEELTFFVENELGKIPVSKKLSILPGKILSIDLSKEVPKGMYDIVLPIKEGISTFKEDIQYVFGQGGEMEEKNILADDIEIDDNRPIYKKISSGFSTITGNLSGVDGFMTRNPLLAPLLLGATVLFLVFKYGRRPIMRMFRKKDSKNDNIEVDEKGNRVN